MSDAQKPSIGRIVHYFDADADRVFAAIITDTSAEDDGLAATNVNLHHFGSGEYDAEDIFDVPFSATASASDHWRWPPRV